MHDRTEWTRGAEIVSRKKALVEFTRPCGTCGQPFSIFVTKNVADGADSNSFGLKNCEAHRRSTKPKAQDPMVELAELRVRDTAQFAEIQQLKAKLAAYQDDEYVRKARSRGGKEKMPWDAPREPYYATGQPMPRTPADGDWGGD